jgi:filamentous hemagglutinin family protein
MAHFVARPAPAIASAVASARAASHIAAVAEACARGERSLLAPGAIAGVLVALLASVAVAGPEAPRVVRGDVTITRHGAETVIRAGRNSIIDYRSFDIARGETVRFQQPDAAARVLNRIQSAQPTRIDGSLLANGRVYIVNPSGVLFGATARVDVAGLYAAAGRLSDSDFVRGLDRFTDLSGRVVNEGSITADFVGLLGRSVGNAGSIDAPRGAVVMAAGEDVMIGRRDGGIHVRVEGRADDAAGPALSNTGDIDATSGVVAMAAGDVYSMAMRVGGTVRGREIRAAASSGQVHVEGTLDAAAVRGGGAGGPGRGGRVEVLGEKVGLFASSIDVSGTRGGGDVRVGGDVRGQGDLPRADVAFVSRDSVIRADATERGDGGSVVVWSDRASRVYGDISAKGGVRGGDGGFIETSSKGQVDLSSREITAAAPRGRAGSWLIDPRDVTITAGGVDDGVIAGGVFNPTIDNANVNRDTIQAALNADTNITITTADPLGTQQGNIAVQDSILKTGGTGSATLTLEAANDIVVSNSIIASSGQLNVVLRANTDPNDADAAAGDVSVGATINTNGGTFASSGVGFDSTASVTATGGITLTHAGGVANAASLDAGDGAVAITAATLDVGATITGRAGITLAPAAAGIGVGLAGGSGGFSLDAAELGRLASTGVVVIGRAGADAGAVQANAFDLSGAGLDRDWSLTLRGSSITMGDVTLKAGKSFTLTAASGDIAAGRLVAPAGVNASATGTYVAGGDIVTFGGDITLASGVRLASDVTFDTTAAGSVTGPSDVGSIAVTGVIDATTAGAESLTIRAGSQGVAGGDGAVLLGGAAGGTTALESFTVVAADAATIASLRVAGPVSLTGRAITLGGGVATLAGGSLTVNNAGVLTIDGAGLSLDGPFTQAPAAAGSTTLAAGIATTGDAVTFVRGVTLADSVSIVTGGGAATFGAGVDADATASARDLTVQAGAGSITLGGPVGSESGLLVRTLSLGGGSISLRNVRTAGGQSYAGVATLAGDLLADAVGAAFNGDVRVGADSTVTVAAGGIAINGRVDSLASGAERSLSLAASAGTVEVAGAVGADVPLASFAASGVDARLASVRSLGAVTFGGTTTLRDDPAAGGLSTVVVGSSVLFSGPVTLDVDTTVTGTTSVTFASSVQSAATLGRTLTVNSPLTSLLGAVGGDDTGSGRLGTLVTDDGGSLTLGGGVVRVSGDITLGDATRLGADTTIDSGGSIAFRSTVDSDAGPSRALTVNSGVGASNTFFAAAIGALTPLASLTTNAAGVTFLPATVRTSGAQAYFDDVRLTADDTRLSASDVNFDRRVNSDTSVRSLEINASGQTRFGGAVGGAIDGVPGALALASLTTDAGGSVVIAGDVTSTGAQSYGENALLDADVTLSANGVAFAARVDSQGVTRRLVVNGGSAVSIAGDAGVLSNLESIDITAGTISLTNVTTVESQTYRGSATLANIVAGGDFDAFGSTSVASVSAQAVRFRRLDALTPAPATISGNIVSTLSGAGVSFQDDLSLAANATISAVDAPVAFGGRVNTLGATARSLVVNTAGETSFARAVGDTNALSNLETDAAGRTAINGGSVRTTGQTSFLDPIVIAGATTFDAASLSFARSLDASVAGADLTATTTGTVTFGGAVGATTPLGRLLVNASTSNRTTLVGGDVTVQRGIVFGGPVQLTENSIIDGGQGTLFFRGAIDSSDGTGRNLALRSAAAAKIASNGDATDIAANGNTAGDVTVTPFRFAGSIGSTNALGRLTLGSDLAASPSVATAAFAFGDGFDASGRIVPQTGMFNDATTFVVAVTGPSFAAGGFSMGKGQKLTVFGSLDLRAGNRPALLSDISSTGSIKVTAGSVAINGLPKNPAVNAVATNQRSGNQYATRPEFLVDVVARSGVDFVIAGGGNATPPGAAAIATDNIRQGAGLEGQIVGLHVAPDGSRQLITQAMFDAPGTNTRLLPLDLVAQRSSTTVTTAVPPPVPASIGAGAAMTATTPSVAPSLDAPLPLAAAGLEVRPVDRSQLVQFLSRSTFVQDVPLVDDRDAMPLGVTAERLSGPALASLLDAYCSLWFDVPAEAKAALLAGSALPADRSQRLADAVGAAWVAYVAATGDAATGEGFPRHLERLGTDAGEADRLALEVLGGVRSFADRAAAAGLSPGEVGRIRRAAVQRLMPGDSPEVQDAVLEAVGADLMLLSGC